MTLLYSVTEVILLNYSSMFKRDKCGTIYLAKNTIYLF